MEPDNSIKLTLLNEIQSQVQEYADNAKISGIKSLEKYNPEKASQILYLASTGVTQTSMVRKYGLRRETIVRVLSTYADHMGAWKELGGQLAAYSYLNIQSLEEDMVNSVREQMENEGLKPTFRDIKEISIAKANASREALLARGEATSISRDEKIYTDKDYKELREQAAERLRELKKVEEVRDV